MALATRVKVKRILGIPAGITVHDTRIDDIVSDVDSMILGEVGQTAITQTTVCEWVPILFMSGRLRLSHWPVISVAGVTQDGSAVAAADYTVDSSGYIDLIDSSAYWTKGRKTVQVTYTYGIKDADLTDVKHAANVWAAAMFNVEPHVGLESEQLDSYNYNLSGSKGFDIPPSVERVLARLRNVIS
jgi:hypothetical protein